MKSVLIMVIIGLMNVIHPGDATAATFRWLKAAEFDEGGVSGFLRASDGTIYATATFMGGASIYRTTDGGTTWPKLSSINGAQWMGSLIETSSKEFYLVAVMGEGEDQAGKVFKSVDGGVHWDPTAPLGSSGGTPYDVMDLLYGVDGAVYAGTGDGGIFKTTDGGQSWTYSGYLGHYERVHDLLQTSDGIMYIATGRGIYKSRSGSEFLSFDKLESFGDRDVECFLQTADGALYATTLGDARIFKTTDGGQTWNNAGEFGLEGAVMSIIQAFDGTMYAMVTVIENDFSRVYRTTDGGVSWEDTGEFVNAGIFVCLVQSSEGVIFAGGTFPLVSGEILLGYIFEYVPLLDVSVSNRSPGVGYPFSIDVTVQPINQTFDVWALVSVNGKLYSFAPDNPQKVRTGIWPLFRGVVGAGMARSHKLFSIPSIPEGTVGDYTVAVGLVPTGTAPARVESCISGYLDQEKFTVASGR